MYNKTAVMTIASANYAPYVATLMQSIQETNPDYDRYLFLADKAPEVQSKWGGLFTVVDSDSISIPSFDDMLFRYDIMEFNTAIKPFAIDWLFENKSYENVIYLDPDIVCYRKFEELDRLLEDDLSVIVTPHLTKPAEDGRTPNDYHMLQAGVFNLGFIAVKKTAEARAFVKWWARRLQTGCYADMPANLFTDQRWIDLVPCFVEKLKVFRNSAYNVAYWNLFQREIKKVRGALTFDGVPLAFFHFSGLSAKEPKLVSKHQDRLSWADIRPLQKLFENCRSALTANGWGELSSTPYAYAAADGIEIRPVMRRLYRELYPNVLGGARFNAAFVLAMCHGPANIEQLGERPITQLMHRIYRERPDVRLAFDLQTADGANAFLHWCGVSAVDEYGLDRRLIEPDAEVTAQVAVMVMPPPETPNAGRPIWFRYWRKFRKRLLELLG